jgi:hypothetical protein
MEKTQADGIISQSRCAMCNRGVYIDAKHGRITCSGCDMYIEGCLCPIEAPAPR